jgi:hypothetical protein
MLCFVPDRNRALDAQQIIFGQWPLFLCLLINRGPIPCGDLVRRNGAIAPVAGLPLRQA